MNLLDEIIDRKDEIERALRFLNQESSVIAIYGTKLVGKTFLSYHILRQFADRLDSRSALRTHHIDFSDRYFTFYDFRRQLGLLLNNPSLSQSTKDDFKARFTAAMVSAPETISIIVLDDFSVDRFKSDLQKSDLKQFQDFFSSLPPKVRIILNSREYAGLKRLLPARSVAIELGDLPDERYATLLIEDTLDRKAFNISGRQKEDLANRIQTEIGRHPGAIVTFLHHCSSVVALTRWLNAPSNTLDEIFEELYSADWDQLSSIQKNFLHWLASVGGTTSTTFVYICIKPVLADFNRTLNELVGLSLIKLLEKNEERFAQLSRPFMAFVNLRKPTGEFPSFMKSAISLIIRHMQDNWEDTNLLTHDFQAVRAMFEWTYNSDRDSCISLYNSILDPMFSVGLFSERIDLGYQALASRSTSSSPTQLATVYNSVVSTLALTGDFVRAQQALRNFGDETEALTDDGARGIYLRASAYVKYRMGHVSEALAICEPAMAASRRAGDQHNFIDLMCIMSSTYLYEGNLSLADRAANDVLAMIDSIPWKRGRAYPLRDLAEINMQQRRMPESWSLLERASEISTIYRDVRQLTRIELSKARWHLYSGDVRSATRLLKAVLYNSERYCLQSEAIEAKRTLAASSRWPAIFWQLFFRLCRPATRFSAATIAGD